MKRTTAALYCTSGPGNNCNAFPLSSKGLKALGVKTCEDAGILSSENTVLQFFGEKKKKSPPAVSNLLCAGALF